MSSVPSERRPLVFVASSSEAIDVCRNLQAELESSGECDVELWTQGVILPSQYTIEGLVDAARRIDFAVIVATPDDISEKRGERTASPRDNVILELGLFVGVLGRQRTYLIADTTVSMQLPTDLLGLTYIPYRPRPSGNHRAAVGTAATQILERVHALGTRSVPISGSALRSATGADQAQVLHHEIQRICADAAAQGWRVRTNSHTTLRLQSPRGRTRTFSIGEPSSSRARLREFAADLRAHGLRVNHSVRRPVADSPVQFG